MNRLIIAGVIATVAFAGGGYCHSGGPFEGALRLQQGL